MSGDQYRREHLATPQYYLLHESGQDISGSVLSPIESARMSPLLQGQQQHLLESTRVLHPVLPKSANQHLAGLPDHWTDQIAPSNNFIDTPQIREGDPLVIQNMPCLRNHTTLDLPKTSIEPICFEHGCNGQRFSSYENYRRHVREKNPQRSVTCPFCSVTFTRKSNLDQHMSRMRCKGIEDMYREFEMNQQWTVSGSELAFGNGRDPPWPLG